MDLVLLIGILTALKLAIENGFIQEEASAWLLANFMKRSVAAAETARLLLKPKSWKRTEKRNNDVQSGCTSPAGNIRINRFDCGREQRHMAPFATDVFGASTFCRFAMEEEVKCSTVLWCVRANETLIEELSKPIWHIMWGLWNIREEAPVQKLSKETTSLRTLKPASTKLGHFSMQEKRTKKLELRQKNSVGETIKSYLDVK